MKSFKTFIEKNDNDPCWDGYKQVGWKKKDGKKVPIFMNKGGMGMAKGGGIESKGKTKGTMIKMTKGGKAC